MTQPCDNCGQPSATPTCDRCAGYQAWASDSGNPRPDFGKRHDQRVRDTRKHLSELPDLYAALSDFWEPGSAPKDPDQRSGKSNPSHRCVVNLDVLDLTDMRLKDGADATRADYWRDSAEGARRQGVIQTLASWCRAIDEDLRSSDLDSDLAEDPTITTETAYLLKHLDWYAKEFAGFVELHDDVRKMWADVRRVMGEQDKPVEHFVCVKCGAEAVQVTGGFLSCTMSTAHDVSVRDLEGQYRRRPALPLKDICAEFHVTQEQVWQWKSRRKIKPARTEGRTQFWLPWDIFCMQNPDIKSAIDMRDAAEAS